MKSSLKIIVLLTLAISYLVPIETFAQAATVDPSFFPVPTNALASDTSFQQVVQSDGKILVYGAPTMFVGGVPRSGIFRLNADGSLDTSFNVTNTGGVGVSSIGLLPDGKIALAGGTAPNHGKMSRLNSDGSLDSSFSVQQNSPTSPELGSAYFYINTVQADGKVIATFISWGNIGGTWYSYSMRRYNLDGSIDSSFVAPTLDGGHLVSTSAIIENLPDGRFYLAITSGNHLGRNFSVSRRLADGSLDATFTQTTGTISGGFFIGMSDLGIAADGGVYAAGTYWPSMVGGPYAPNMKKLLPSGAVDSTFTSPAVPSGSQVKEQPGGKVLYSASMVGAVTRPLVRLNADGTVDPSFVLDPTITTIKNRWVMDSAGRAIFLAATTSGVRFVRLQVDGTIDPTFAPSLGVAGTTSVVAAQADGKTLVVGAFSQLNGVARNGFARVNSDGTLDSSFDPGTGFNVAPKRVIVQADGKIIAVGPFSMYNGSSVSRVIRLLANGTLDSSFSPTITGSSVDTADLQPDGKILIGGSITAVNGTSRTGVARLEANGNLDTTFNTVLGGNGYVGSVVAEPNGKVAIIGNFSGVNGVSRNSFARLESSGATDITFNAPTNLPSMGGLKRQSDGKYITFPNGPIMERWNSDGTRDSSFTSPNFMEGGSNGTISDVLVRSDGSYIVAGNFNQIGSTTRNYITRLKRNGTHDATFITSGANGQVSSLSTTSSGKVLVSGNFSTIESVSRLGIVRLDVPAVNYSTLFDFDGDGRADFAVFRPSTNQWYELLGGGSSFESPVFGLAGDIPVPADFDGDGKTDEAIFRPSTGTWWYQSSINGVQLARQYGAAGDLPRPGDIDADGKADFVVFRPSTNQWYRVGTTVGELSPYSFGLAGDQPVIGDFDGDGKADPAIFRPSTGDWWYAASSAVNQHRAAHWGASGDVPTPADFDGDGKTDIAVYRPSTGVWYVYNSSNLSFTILPFGLNGDRPVVADYDGDGRADIALFRPSTGIWYLLRSTAGFTGLQWGVATDIAIPAAFNP